MHRPLRPASAEPATVTSPAAYEGAVTTDRAEIPAVARPGSGVRLGAYNGRVTTNATSTISTSAAAPAVGR